MSVRRAPLGPTARRVAGLVIGLLTALMTITVVSVLTFGEEPNLIVPLCLFIVFGSGAVSLSRRRMR